MENRVPYKVQSLLLFREMNDIFVRINTLCAEIQIFLMLQLVVHTDTTGLETATAAMSQIVSAVGNMIRY
jgi:hypothetical protein